MGREVRMVPPDWEHPKDDKGNHLPLQSDYPGACMYWCADYYKSKEWRKDMSLADAIEEIYECPPPKREDYMPIFEPGTATHYCMYETCTEGTPISPAFATPEELAQWLADNGASAFGHMTATYEQWLATINSGSALSAVWSPGSGLVSGVAYQEQEG